ncbi:MAG: GNAT family N-acetyltransferase [Sphingobacteriales bacterium]|nr:MAG: GNAT family N-acetyltransferase [Sphingobacteriales bacterium]
MSEQSRYRELAGQLSLPVFFQPWWLDITSPGWDAVIVEEEGEVRAAWPYGTEQKAGFRIMRNPPMTPYLGPLFFLPPKEKVFGRWNQEDAIFEAFWKKLPRWDFFEVLALPGYDNFLPFHQAGFSVTMRLTYHLNLSQPAETLLDNMKSGHRNHIRKAAKDLKIEDGLPLLPRFYTLNRATLERKGKKYFFDQQVFTELISTACARRSGLVQAALHPNGEVAAMVFTCYDEHTMYLLLSAANPDAIHNGAVALLIWDAILKAKEMGLKTFDFEGSMDKGIETFFRGFAGERKSYLSCTSQPSGIWKLKRALLG